MTAVVLDTGPLGQISNPRLSPESQACLAWARGIVAGGTRVVVPEIADYELRRELIRAGKASGLQRLDAVKAALEYLPITTASMREAARLWAAARNAGLPTAPKEALDGDAILAAQALSLGLPEDEMVVATTNVGTSRASSTRGSGRRSPESAESSPRARQGAGPFLRSGPAVA